jgi:glycosyltransferase involved in cell wall biosynthesis
MLKTLFMPEWHVDYLDRDSDSIQGPDKLIREHKYWFFKFDNRNLFDVDVIDCRPLREWQMRHLNFYLTQSTWCYLVSNRYDIFISHGFKSAGAFSMYCKLLNNKKRHYIFDVGCINGARNNSRYFNLYKTALESNCFLISHTKCQIDFYKRYLNLANRPIYIPFGVDTEYFRPKGIKKKNYILSFGNSLRDYDTLLRTWENMRKPSELHIVGAAANLCNKTGGIKCFPAMNILDLINKMEECLFAIIPLPVQYYSCGQMSLLQTMSMGTPVVVSKVPSTEDYVEDGNGAIFVNPYDEIDMRDKIELMLNGEIRMEVGSKARKYVIDKFGEEAMAKQIFEYVMATC